MTTKELDRIISVTPKEYRLLKLINESKKNGRVIVDVTSLSEDVTHTYAFFDQ